MKSCWSRFSFLFLMILFSMMVLPVLAEDTPQVIKRPVPDLAPAEDNKDNKDDSSKKSSTDTPAPVDLKAEEESGETSTTLNNAGENSPSPSTSSAKMSLDSSNSGATTFNAERGVKKPQTKIRQGPPQQSSAVRQPKRAGLIFIMSEHGLQVINPNAPEEVHEKGAEPRRIITNAVVKGQLDNGERTGHEYNGIHLFGFVW